MVEPGTGSMVMCPADTDFFSLAAARGEIVNITLINDNSQGDLDLYLYNQDMVELEYSTGWGTVEEDVSEEVYSDSLFYVEVVPKEQSAEDIVNYHLTLELEPFTPCDDDAYEPNDSREEATLVTDLPFTQVGSDWVLELLDFQACRPGPVDWFAFDLEEGTVLTILVRFIDADGDIDISFYDPDESWLDGGSSTTDNEEIVFDATDPIPQTGRYTLKVFPFSSFTGLTTYDLVVTADRPFP
jgi:hypothetical protein